MAADFAKIRDLLIQIADTKILRPMKVGEKSQLGRLELQVPGEGDKSGTLLTFFAEGETPQAKLLLGKQSMKKSEASSFGGGEFPDGRYIMVDGDMQRISQVSETFSAVTTEPKQWLDKTFFKVEKLQSVSVTHPDVTNNWSVSRESDSGDMVLMALLKERKWTPVAPTVSRISLRLQFQRHRRGRDRSGGSWDGSGHQGRTQDI